MSLNLELVGSKLRRYREQLQLSLQEVASATGVPPGLLAQMEDGKISPTGDQILILADFYQCDYRFFISGEQLAPFEQTENLYRRYGREFTKEDRRSVQEFLFLCECEEMLFSILEKSRRRTPRAKRVGTLYKAHAESAAAEIRGYLGYKRSEVRGDVYEDFRSLGCHVFRRELSNSNISGLCIRHPVVGPCLLINYGEDVYRQRFSAAHEAGHAFLDYDQDVVVSFNDGGGTEGSTSDDVRLREMRANFFASYYLMPPELLKLIPEPAVWPRAKVVEWANKLKVSTEALSIALKRDSLVSIPVQAAIKNFRVPLVLKEDPELPSGLAPRTQERKEALLRRGLSGRYVSLCFDAFEKNLVSAARLAEMLLVDEAGLAEISSLFGITLQHVN